MKSALNYIRSVAQRMFIERCQYCGNDAGDNWFDRSICACGVMHTCCARCGYPLDGCDMDKS